MLNGKSLVAGLSNEEALAGLKPAVALLNSPECPIRPIPQQYRQPEEAQQAYDDLKSAVDAAHPDDSQAIGHLRGTREVFNVMIGDFVDLVVLGARKDPELPAKFNMDFLLRPKPNGSKISQNERPVITVSANDNLPSTVNGKAKGAGKRGMEIYYAYDDPSNEASWMYFNAYVNGTFVMNGLVSGKRAYIRGRYLLGKGKKSPWSNIVSIMVP